MWSRRQRGLITPQAVARLDDGTSIVAGSTADQRVFIVRLTATGAIHPGWGGYRYVDVDQGSEQVAFVDERGGTVVVGGGSTTLASSSRCGSTPARPNELRQRRRDRAPPGEDRLGAVHRRSHRHRPRDLRDGRWDRHEGAALTWPPGALMARSAPRARSRPVDHLQPTARARSGRKIVIVGLRALATATRSPGSSARPPPTRRASTAPSARSSPVPRARPPRSTWRRTPQAGSTCWGVERTATRSRATQTTTPTLDSAPASG